MRIHAAELGIDPERLAAGGASAGGHIVLSSGVFESDDGASSAASISAKPNALVLFNPVIDLTSEDMRKRILQDFGAAVADRIEEISPFQHIHNGLPPTIILNGRADTSTPYATAEEYCRRVVTRGNDCRIVGYDGAEHGFFNAPHLAHPASKGGKWYRPTLREVDRFLTSIGYLPSPAPSEIP